MSIDRVSDAELIARARQGDTAAFGELVNRHKAAVYRAALAALGSPADADDAAQDAFVSAFRRLATFRGEASFKTWLLTITWNQALNRRRKLTAQAGLVGRVGLAGPASGDSPEPRARWVGAPRATERSSPRAGENAGRGEVERVASRDRTPEQLAVDRQLAEAIVAEIRALPVKLKDTLLLAQSGEYSYDEIAAMVGSAPGTIKWRVSEARKTLKARLRERGFDDVG